MKRLSERLKGEGGQEKKADGSVKQKYVNAITLLKDVMFEPALCSRNKHFKLPLIGLAVFAFVLIVEHGEVGLVTALGDQMVFQSF